MKILVGGSWREGTGWERGWGEKGEWWFPDHVWRGTGERVRGPGK
jgi:hypothetical protein